MSESKSKLEQVLEFLLAEDNERAEELLHEYVVETARKEYERILDDAEVSTDETVAEAVDSEEEVAEAEESEEEAVEEAEESEEEAVEEEIDQADPEADFVSDVEEATKLSDKVAEPKGGEADNNDSGNAKKGPSKIVSPHGQGEPVKVNDGGDGDSGDNSPKDSGGSSNLNVEPKKV